MAWKVVISLLGALIALAMCQPAAVVPPSNEPCGVVSVMVQNSTGPYPQIPAELAWDCLMSVPLNASAAVTWLESLKPYMEWQR